ncbi:hypothetical protein AB0P12_32730 [Streptomyces subrutilus]|uniref:hypothetical protein n=1 Tax=Streptomyces subrutilus TaxID=36818 RepID=UPI00342E4AA2
MRTAVRTLLAALVVAAALSGCSGSGSDPEPRPSPPRTATTGTPPAAGTGPSTGASASASASGQVEACVAAIAGQAAEDPGRLRTEPRPAGCEGLEDATYLQAYYDALKRVTGQGGAGASPGG